MPLIMVFFHPQIGLHEQHVQIGYRYIDLPHGTGKPLLRDIHLQEFPQILGGRFCGQLSQGFGTVVPLREENLAAQSSWGNILAAGIRHFLRIFIGQREVIPAGIQVPLILFNQLPSLQVGTIAS